MTAPAAPALPATQLQTNTPLTDDPRWRAVLQRDAAYDGSFVYAVASTGIYCRPSCPSRKPARSRVSYFSVAQAAEAAGYRPCRRCRPEQHPCADPHLDLAHRVCQLIQESHGPQGEGTAPTLAQLGRQLGASPYHLQRVFKKVMGVSPRQYAAACRLAHLKSGLKESPGVAGALYQAGYGSPSGLYHQGVPSLGMTPSRFQKGGTGVGIAYTVAYSPLGLLLVAATQRGVCAVTLGDDEGEMQAELCREYPAAEICRDDAGLRTYVAEVLDRLEGRLPHVEIPLDLRATAFQRLVWQELQRIPRGETRTYSQVARALEQPSAVRAVARACGSNPAAVVIPCHRVVRQDGDLAGYRWGRHRKAALLARERESSDGRQC